MTTETETLSLPTSTAPTDITESTCLPTAGPCLPSPCEAAHHSTAHAAAPPEWDTTIVPNINYHHTGGARFTGACGTGTGGSSIGSSSAAGSEFMYNLREDDAATRGPGRSVEEACKRSLNHFPCPSLSFPMPALEFDFRIAVKLNPEATHVDSGTTKEITTVAAGVWSGSFGHGRVIAGGYDLGQARGFRPMRLVEGAFVVQTSDEPAAVLEMRTRGSLSGPSDVLDALLSPKKPKDIDPRRYGFRMFATIKTADKRYAEIVNCGLWVASGAWRGEHLIIE